MFYIFPFLIEPKAPDVQFYRNANDHQPVRRYVRDIYFRDCLLDLWIIILQLLAFQFEHLYTIMYVNCCLVYYSPRGPFMWCCYDREAINNDEELALSRLNFAE